MFCGHIAIGAILDPLARFTVTPKTSWEVVGGFQLVHSLTPKIGEVETPNRFKLRANGSSRGDILIR